MATYKYTAFDENEKNLKGFINASDADEARLIFCLLYTSPSPRDDR